MSARTTVRPGVAVLALALGGVGLLAPACGSGFMDGLVGGIRPPDAGVDAAPACALAGPPERPGVPDNATNLQLTFAFSALRADTVGLEDAGAPIPRSLDLDRTCTCPEPESCVRFDDGAARGESCDGEGGRDNGLSVFFNQVGAAVPEFRGDFATERISEGTFTLLVDVFGWNGGPDDPSVTVRLRMSTGYDDVLSGRKKPLFDGADVWMVDPASMVQGEDILGEDCRTIAERRRFCTPKIIDTQAYVSNGKLVARLREGGGTKATIFVRSGAGTLFFELLDTVIVANLTRTTLDGEIVGRWPVESILGSLANVENPLSPSGMNQVLCEGSRIAYNQVKSAVCLALDLAGTSDLDRVPGTRCGAVSSALSFRAGPAVAGRVIMSDPKPNACGDWKDDCTKP